MPLTDAPNRPTRSKRKRPIDQNVEIIDITSDDEEPLPVKQPKPKAGRKLRSSPEKRHEIVDITSEDNDVDTGLDSERHYVCSKLQTPGVRQCLEEENKRLQLKMTSLLIQKAEVQTQMARLREELQGAKSAANGMNLSKIDDHICCEICTLKMWRPFILPACGHTFCMSCLQDWFQTILTRHVREHPQWDISLPSGELPTSTALALQRYPRVYQDVVTVLIPYRSMPGPQYTCPRCRASVKTAPIEDYALKAIVAAVATETGEKPQESLVRRGKGKAKAQPAEHPWAKFFP
ncbi:hypothetical protein FISHEDRAFT_69220 [Fistulina hepatica ATCC 64428]|uniref:RING-type domain-containing protein n=1 Tax=Fistulina hepatica ATCC 64428 TaxID=1128425 RepID=A0A0D7AMV1_9AGAR|nr:hypothetical protein FISHEDRAFT_69220 [Fistulina hepatica ATCC 64428]